MNVLPTQKFFGKCFLLMIFKNNFCKSVYVTHFVIRGILNTCVLLDRAIYSFLFDFCCFSEGLCFLRVMFSTISGLVNSKRGIKRDKQNMSWPFSFFPGWECLKQKKNSNVDRNIHLNKSNIKTQSSCVYSSIKILSQD